MLVILFSLIALAISLVGWFVAMAMATNIGVDSQSDIFIAILVSQIAAVIVAGGAIIGGFRAKKKKGKLGVFRSIGIAVGFLSELLAIVIIIFFANSLLSESDVDKNIHGFDRFDPERIEGIDLQ